VETHAHVEVGVAEAVVGDLDVDVAGTQGLGLVFHELRRVKGVGRRGWFPGVWGDEGSTDLRLVSGWSQACQLLQQMLRINPCTHLELFVGLLDCKALELCQGSVAADSGAARGGGAAWFGRAASISMPRKRTVATTAIESL